jgi:hypothetical protein
MLYAIDLTRLTTTAWDVNITHLIIPPGIIIPTSQVAVVEDGIASMVGLSVQGDAGSHTTTGLFEHPVSVSLHVTNGLLSLHSTERLVFAVGTGTSDPVIRMSGSIDEVNNALAVVTHCDRRKRFSIHSDPRSRRQ